MLRPLIICLALALAAGPAVAQQVAFGGIKADTKAPVEVTAESLQVQQADNTATFNGNVVIGQGAMRLTADKVKVVYAQGDRGRIQSLDATGNVTLVSGKDVAQAESGVYDVASGNVTLKGGVTLTQGQNILTGETMQVNLADGTANVSGRVRSILQPGGN
ncbi:lipopolysaccharide transport periplasmic protein LptA [Paracoccus pacificus]|uniref:Lipopolysaccharide transport periplasmic protein LptA n=1 Tax=Paracoccus pacificus TaxID=1463598 RepID=A0ABW4R641_9RHOB